MNGSSQPLGTGTTFWNMNEFPAPKSQQQTAAPAPVTATPEPSPAPAAAPAAAPSIMSYQDWMKKNPVPMKAGPGVAFKQQPHQGRMMPSYNDRMNTNQNQYMMEMIRQLGGLPQGSQGAFNGRS